jgi:hypothetical protein
MLENYRVRMPSMGRLPRPRLTFLQTNYRAYVVHKGEPAVWFFAMELGTPVAAFDKALYGTPTAWARLSLDYEWDAEASYYGRYRFRSASFGRKLLLEIDGLDRRAEAAECFDSPAELIDFFCQPMTGYHHEPDTGWLSRMVVQHKAIAPKTGVLRTAHSDILASLGLVYPDELSRPHSVLLNPGTLFKGYLPDRGIVL